MKKILLVMLPYWDPLIPPQGISFIKNYLQANGYIVKTYDGNIRKEFKEFYNSYYNLLKNNIPENKQGNFFNIGHDVLRNHLMAHLNSEELSDYVELVRTIIYKTFFTEFNDDLILEFRDLLTDFYDNLKNYVNYLLKSENPDVFGVSVQRDSVAPSLYAFKLAKEFNSGILNVMGGSVFMDNLSVGSPNLEFFTEKTPYIDKIIIGDGQKLLLQVLQGKVEQGKRVLTNDDIIDEQHTSEEFFNKPDLSDFNINDNYTYLAAQGSFSCPFQCSFCNVATFAGDYMEKDPKQVVSEMKAMWEKYDSRLFFMNDALLNNIADSLATIFLEQKIHLYWDGYLRVSNSVIDQKNTIHWRKGGFYRARLGVESGSQNTLDAMGKKITPKMTIDSLKSLANAGIKTTTYWVIGHPGETEEDFQQTLDLLEEAKNYIYEAECNPFIYSYNGQSDTNKWKDYRELLYPKKAKDTLIIQSWICNVYPSREETYIRINRFVDRCNELGIPNPYTIYDIYQADERWKNLNKNAVPNVIDIKDKNCKIEESLDVKLLSELKPVSMEDTDFDF